MLHQRREWFLVVSTNSDPHRSPLHLTSRGAVTGGTLTEMLNYNGAWEGPIGLGATITGSPSVTYNPTDGSTYVVFNNGLFLGGWNGPFGLGATISGGSPSVAYVPADDFTDVYFDSGGNLTELYYDGGWHGPFNLGAPIS
jgi:hypothetical protein